MTLASDQTPDPPPGSVDATRLTAEQAAAVAEARAVSNTTRRVVAPALEDLLYQAIPVLDKGFVRVIDYMGDDHAIVQAARVSYGAGTKTVRTDAGLIDYLMRHQHTSPFEMCDIKLHVKLPVFVARQWIRHRTASVNEYSGRYSEIADSFYEPEPSAIGRQSSLEPAGQCRRRIARGGGTGDRCLAGWSSAGLRPVPVAADRRGRRCRARGGPDRAARQPLHGVVLEGQPAQPAALPGAAHGQPCAIRDPGLRGGHRAAS